MDTKIISLVLILLCIFWLFFEMRKISNTKEKFTQENIYFTREEPYSFTNLLSTLNLLKEKTNKYSSLLQDLKVVELAADYENTSNEALLDASEESS